MVGLVAAHPDLEVTVMIARTVLQNIESEKEYSPWPKLGGRMAASGKEILNG
jgi:hypothetical protein